MVEYGVFNPEGMWYGPVSKEEAEREQTLFFQLDPQQEDYEAEVMQLCEYHEGYARYDCEVCYGD